MPEAVLIGSTANERFKRGAGSWFWGGVVVATAVHYLLFAFFPALHAEDLSVAAAATEAVNMPPDVHIPPPPEKITRPATPVVGDANIDSDITIPKTLFEHDPSTLPPVPEPDKRAVIEGPIIVPMTVVPKLLNRSEIQRTLERDYPAMLRDSGIGGSPVVWFHIDEHGRVLETRLKDSSGYPQLDGAAMEVGKRMRFSPAQNMDRVVAVWIYLPITFKVNR